ncbi:DUF1648 domain-containing protein [Clostridium perfringens]|uniref:DUF1648 domain-containing protein n=1 Tax=Clostridium perfringens TaxID=1502 RepID=UPI0039EA599C|nr:DUF1648 domain-containing protein [Clostridium perfringens]MDM0461456.1 DUF1648 domain-containing protein [Clostridium perfringens]
MGIEEMFTQKILSYKKILKINMFFLILCLAINIILSKNLPNKVALQIVSSGELDNYIPKLFFIFFTPIVISLITFYNYMKTELRVSRSIVPIIVMFILNIIILITNLFA